MRFCDECGAHIDDNAKFCEECGAVLDDVNNINENIDVDLNGAQKEQSNKKKNNTVVVIVGAILLVGVVGVAVYMGLNSDSDNKSTNNAMLESESVTTIEETTEETTTEETTTEETTTEETTTEETTTEEITVEETTIAVNQKQYIDEYINLISEKGYAYTYQLICLDNISTPLLAVYNSQQVDTGFSGTLYMYTDTIGLQDFECQEIYYLTSGDRILVKTFTSMGTETDYYFQISENGMKKLGETRESPDYDGTKHYYLNDNEVDSDTAYEKSNEWYGYHMSEIIENGKYNYEEIKSMLNLLSNN